MVSERSEPVSLIRALLFVVSPFLFCKLLSPPSTVLIFCIVVFCAAIEIVVAISVCETLDLEFFVNFMSIESLILNL